MRKIEFGISIAVVYMLTALPILSDWPRSSAPGACAEPDSALLSQCDFESGRFDLSLPVNIANQRYRFGLATGNFSFLAQPFANRLARVPPGLDIPDDRFVSVVFRAPPLEAFVGPMRLHFPYPFVQCGQMSSLGNYAVGYDGVIGLDILVQHVVQIDFDEGIVRFLRSVPHDAGERFEVSSFRKKPRACAVTIRATCGQEPSEDYYVEFENPAAISIRSPIYRRLVDKKQLRRVHLESTFGSSKYRMAVAGTVESFSLGRFQTKNVRAVASGDNIIGLQYLSRYTVTLDLPGGFIYLRPGKQFDRVDGVDVSGIDGRWRKDGLEITHCEPSSPADLAGLQKYDIILKVDGRPIGPNSQSAFRERIQKDGSILRIHLKRGEARHDAELKLEAVPGQIIDEFNANSHVPVSDAVPSLEPRDEPPELPELELPDKPRNASREGNKRGDKEGPISGRRQGGVEDSKTKQRGQVQYRSAQLLTKQRGRSSLI